MGEPGIVSYGLSIPPKVVPARAIARRFGVPLSVVTEKQGLREKHVSGARVMPSDLAAAAAQEALQRARRKGIRPRDIELVVYVGSQWKDYHVWLMSAHLQERLRLSRAFAFDMSSMCTGVVFGLSLAKDLLTAQPGRGPILLVGASTESRLVRPRDPASLWMDNFADAGVAVVVARDRDENVILGSDFLSDGSLSLATLQRGGGARHPLYPPYQRAGQVYLENLMPPAEFRGRMQAVSLRNFGRVIRRAVARSSLAPADVRLLVLNHMKRRFHRSVLARSGIPRDRTWYLEDFGHSQSADPILALDQAIRSGTFSQGPVVLAAAGAGYVWGATVVRWG